MGASFTATKPGAWLRLEAVPHTFARDMAEWLREHGDVEMGDGNEPMMLVAFAPCVDEDPRMSPGPTLRQLLAVWNASTFVEDASKRGRCAVCDRNLEEVEDAGPLDAGIPRCDRECPGTQLRAARKAEED